MTSTADLKTIHIARDTGAAQCMRSLGFSGWTAETVITWSPRTYVEDDLFDYFDSADAARSGYSRPDLKAVAAEQAELVKQAERAKASTTAPTAAQMNVYEGRTTGTVSGKKIPVGGCTAEASRLISADTKLPMDPRRLAVTARISAFNDSRMRTAVVQWQKCMAEKGFDYADPAVARLDIRWASRSADSEPSQEELRVAIQDAHCQETTNLVGLYKTLRIAYETPLVSEHKSDLAASLLVFRQWVANAKKVIRAG